MGFMVGMFHIWPSKKFMFCFYWKSNRTIF